MEKNPKSVFSSMSAERLSAFGIEPIGSEGEGLKTQELERNEPFSLDKTITDLFPGQKSGDPISGESSGK